MQVIEEIETKIGSLIVWVVDYSDTLEEFILITSERHRVLLADVNDIPAQNELRVSFKGIDGQRLYDLSTQEIINAGITSKQVADWKSTIRDRTDELIQKINDFKRAQMVYQYLVKQSNGHYVILATNVEYNIGDKYQHGKIVQKGIMIQMYGMHYKVDRVD